MNQAPETAAQTLYPQFSSLDFPAIDREIRAFWERERIFERSIETREGNAPFTFYEGPPSANGKPGIHHVMARAIKDLFCRYQTLKGRQVKRKGGWDTHGLPIELQVEKELGITKKDIGTKISVEEYNRKCRETVMRFKSEWDEVTRRMGYWVDLENPYITFENDYIESVWYLLSDLYKKELLYKGYTIQPYSPAAGTGLSSHELNMPGCYKPVKDTSAVAMFRVTTDGPHQNDFVLAWTTTPWTLPANSALVVGEKITYAKVESYNQYSGQRIRVLVAKDRLNAYFPAESAELDFDAYKQGDKHIPWRLVSEHPGKELVGLHYAPLFSFIQPDLEGGRLDAFRVIPGDFVTTEDGTGVVHCSPTFGADDARAAKQAGIASIVVRDENGEIAPIVDKQGKYVAEMGEFAGRYVKNYTDDANFKDLDEDLCQWLRSKGLLFKKEKYEHNYPHCWRTDKPVLYYPLDSWFIRTSRADIKQRMVELNETITWKPAATGTGRFKGWLENLEDWNLSRSRYWGIPLPIWRNEDKTETKCIGSVAELKAEVEKARAAGISNPVWDEAAMDLHRPFIDEWVLADSKGNPMRRELDLIDVWFDSGAMPYAQWHYPFEQHDTFKASFPADFIAEGVDQTRGWFFTLHAIASMTHNSVAFKTVVSNGLVLDKNGNKMSKRLGNAVDPIETLDKYGADPTRWYMIENANPWENLKFNLDHLAETQRKFFGTLYNTYQFFALYANIDSWKPGATTVPRADRAELDRWILSRLNTLLKDVDAAYADYEPTRAARLIQDFTVEELSNWYVRLCRRRFWKGELTTDKQAAYETLHQVLTTLAQLMSPIAPFFADWLFRNLTECARTSGNALYSQPSVHLTLLPAPDAAWMDTGLEARMKAAQDICSLAHGIRKRVKINVRRPLGKLMVALKAGADVQQYHLVEALVKSEINVKEIEYLAPDSTVIRKNVKANFKVLGAQLGARMKAGAAAIEALTPEQIATIEQGGTVTLSLEGQPLPLTLAEVDIRTEDIPGWAVASNGAQTVALDVTLTEELVQEGIARELVNRLQNLRKDTGLEVTDRIRVELAAPAGWHNALTVFKSYICGEILAEDLLMVDALADGHSIEIDGDTAMARIHTL